MKLSFAQICLIASLWIPFALTGCTTFQSCCDKKDGVHVKAIKEVLLTIKVLDSTGNPLPNYKVNINYRTKPVATNQKLPYSEKMGETDEYVTIDLVGTNISGRPIAKIPIATNCKLKNLKKATTVIFQFREDGSWDCPKQ